MFDGQLVLRIMARTGGHLAGPERLQFPPDGGFVQRDAEFLPYPLRQVLETPADHAMDRRDRPVLDDLLQRPALLAAKLRRRSRCLAVNQPVRPFRTETQHPVPDNLKTDTADTRPIRACTAVMNFRQSKKPAALGRISEALAICRKAGLSKSSRNDIAEPIANLRITSPH